MTFQIGERIGDYEVIGVLGAGGMGKVYKVRNVISERVEAMKVLLPNLESDPDLADRFMREIKVQASLTHPNIAGLHTAQRINNQLVMLMEFVEGVTIEEQLHAGTISIEKGVEYVVQVLSALGYAHAHGVIHRDIKPANMMLTASGIVKLMDFGIAKISADPKLTQTGHTVGSLYYMSPEQINGATLDARSDLYSLGVSLYEIVTGTRPFKGDSDYSIMAAHLNSTPVPPLQIDPKLPSMLNEIIMMSIAREATQRFQSADAFRNALQSLQLTPAQAQTQVRYTAPTPRPTGPAVAAPPVGSPVATPPYPPTAPQKGSRRGLYMAVGSLATIAVVVLAAFEGPKYFQSSGASSVPASLTPTVASVQPQNTPPAQNATPVVAQPTSEPVAPVASQTSPAPTVANPSPVVNSNTLAKPVPQKQSPTLMAQVSQVPNTAAPTSAVVQSTPPPQAAQQAPQTPVDEGKAAAINSHRELLMLLDTRANSIKGSLRTMQQQQANSGLNMRGDIVVAQQRMEVFLNEAEASLKSGDPVKGKKNLDSAEREIEKLEKFLGH